MHAFRETSLVFHESTEISSGIAIENVLVKSWALPEAVVRKCSIKNVFIIISQENACVGVSFFDKAAGCRPETLLKRNFSTDLFLCIF